MDRCVNHCDVVVIGGGPAGTAISALLAEEGWYVEVVEKIHFPAFTSANRCCPTLSPCLDRLRVLQEVEKIGLQKYGVELIS